MNNSNWFSILIGIVFLSCTGRHADTGDARQSISEAMNPGQPVLLDSLDGKPVFRYVLENSQGMRVTLSNYGATIMTLEVPDKEGRNADIVLGYDQLAGYIDGQSYFGCVVGRYANRIAGAQFTLDGRVYKLFANNGSHTLHGGRKGFDRVVWEGRQDGNTVRLLYRSVDGEEGFPGNLDLSITYRLTDSNTLEISYAASTDQPTVVNLSNHSYFNLAGQGTGDVLGHRLQLFCDSMTPVDSTLIPTGKIVPVGGTPFDFRSPQSIGARIDHNDPQLIFGKGYDHNFVVNGPSGTLRPVARVTEPVSGRVMEMLTTEPGIQLYTGNFLDGREKGKGSVYQRRYGFCLETQHYPNSPNQPSFPGTRLEPGKPWSTTTLLRFSTTAN